MHASSTGSICAERRSTAQGCAPNGRRNGVISGSFSLAASEDLHVPAKRAERAKSRDPVQIRKLHDLPSRVSLRSPGTRKAYNERLHLMPLNPEVLREID